MIWSYLFIVIAIVLACIRVRFAGALEFAAPLPMGPLAWWLAAGVAAALAALAAWLDRNRLKDPVARRALAELVIIPAFILYEWALLPPKGYRWFDWAVLAALALAAAAMLRRNWPQDRVGLTLKFFVPACKRLAIPTALLMVIPVAGGIAIGSPFNWSWAGMQAATYPFYALIQLTVFQVFMVSRLRRASGSTFAVTAVSAGIFMMVHWPNGPLMVACGSGAILWTLVYLQRPNVYALALSMGLAAAVLSSSLPREAVLKNLRTGPIYIHRMLEAAANPA